LALCTIATRPALADDLSSQVLVVYAANDPDSTFIANYYAGRRSIPPNLCALTFPDPTALLLSYDDYVSTFKTPVQNCLSAVGPQQVLEPLRRRYPSVACVVLTVYEDDERIFQALCAGACGYMLKRTPPAKLLESLWEVVTGGAPMSPEIARRVVGLFRSVRPPERADYNLTPNELRILKLLVEGHSYKSAAAELGVAYYTIGFHQNIYRKLQVHSKSEAVAKALRSGLAG
jgi:DNA-binding NarL/FixJ family response regulator